MGIFLKKKTTPYLKVGVALALAGMYLLCITGDFTLSYGDFFTLLCSVCFSLQIMAVDYFSPKVCGMRLSFNQFVVVSVFSFAAMMIFEKPSIHAILECAGPVLYAGVFSSGVAYTLQILGQKEINPAIAALTMSAESVFSVISGWIVLGEVLTGREMVGCILMFAAIILSQLPEKKR